MHSVVRALVAGDQKYHLQSRSFCLEFAAIWYKRSCLTFCLFPAYEVSRIEILASGVVKSSRAQPSFRALLMPAPPQADFSCLIANLLMYAPTSLDHG